MLFSQNPISGAVEAYTDDGEFIGVMATMGDDVKMENNKADDEE